MVHRQTKNLTQAGTSRLYRDTLIGEENNKEAEIELLKKLLKENHEEYQKELQELKNIVKENNKETEIEQLKKMLEENHKENQKEIEAMKNNSIKMYKCIIETIFTNNRNEQDKKQIINSAMNKIYNVKVNEEEKQTIEDHQKECNTQDREETKIIEELVKAKDAIDFRSELKKLVEILQDNTNNRERLSQKLSKRLTPQTLKLFRDDWDFLQSRKMPRLLDIK